MKCQLISPDASFKEAHLLLWNTSGSRWPNALQPLLIEMAHHDEAQTTSFGLLGVCQRLSLLPESDITQPAVLRRLLNAIETLLPSPVQQPVALDLAGFNLADETTFVRLRGLLVAIMNRFYQLPQLGYRREQPQSKGELWLVAEPNNALARRLAAQAEAIARGMLLSRQLADLPAQDCRPQDVARRAEEWAAQHPQTCCEVLDEQAIFDGGLGCLHATGKGSVNPPRLVTLRWQGAGEHSPVYALVGKGITFDTGGLWLKEGEGMRTMKYDMCGAAVVFGMMETVKALNLPLNIVAVMALAENMPGSTAMLPGDVVKAHAGVSVEIMNTDAEGRLVLADALSYAAERFEPAEIIDVATLTGAVVKALGYDISGMMSNNEFLSQRLQHAGNLTQDRVWPLPLDESFDGQVKSTIADLTNTPPNNAAIAVSAAQFLSKFCHHRPWAHLDVSGTALSRGKFTQASGRPAHLLTHYLLSLCEAR
ncbi:Cytosol aminopeptidase [Cedecea davisae]|uniref:Putative leucyl aminopeptidase n=1 Tax=Cedecea davisae DSM 4568 TaxID=566551 RepID=S3IY40_9ENTR|nr:leucyl aminopeptidase family protein [Cedecea davisae]EPF18608.1 putative leucyl aminopeptidase [Cedecea davisae DSM 4568]SUX28555.1 Cytosol aminopeptidase [Cedecea davisae]